MLLLICIFITGLCVGSFLNVVIYRLPIMLNRSWQNECEEFLNLPITKHTPKVFNLCLPQSQCPKCNHKITILENIPVISYLFLLGKCKKCNNKISIKYPLIELITGIITLVLFYHFGLSYNFLFTALLSWSLIALTIIDFEHTLLPDEITMPMLWSGLLLHAFGLFNIVSLRDAIVGAVAGYLALWTISYIFKLITGKQGMGNGDFKILAMLGAWLGWKMLPLIIFMAALLGSIIGCIIIYQRGRENNIIAFGPYLAISGWVAMLWGNDIIACYLQSIL